MLYNIEAQGAAFRKIWEDGTSGKEIADQSWLWFDNFRTEWDRAHNVAALDEFADEMRAWLDATVLVSTGLTPFRQRLD